MRRRFSPVSWSANPEREKMPSLPERTPSMVDRLTKERRSWLMSRIRGVNTAPERALRRALYALGVRGWRLYPKGLPGKPDLVFRTGRLVVFVDGAFWHGHPSKFSPGRLPNWWERKILLNQARDRRVDAELKRLGWRVVRIWDIALRKDASREAQRVERVLLARRALEAARAHRGRSR